MREREWLLLQTQHEQYEFAALALKLAAVAGLAFGARWLPVLLLVLWLQDAILKTFQARLGARLERVERLLREGAGEEAAMQLHSEWAASRPRGLGLLREREYLLSACRPTVAFPYLVLLLPALFF